ncbi:hypothetical protein C162_26765 [Paenibacillus sp. FSL R7-269]|uniref:hypothetical protein n=1 Tax=Paenibacillus sp. FSL R7-269 TaxID=1226755 RepID=UPI0003E293D6|nr:hypothetical protein [Paenibacillus sp. FSL R7-269]ETT40929.1 hypothetical protein C162_26765 [Paenibacillus sp. FSL R7-269]
MGNVKKGVTLLKKFQAAQENSGPSNAGQIAHFRTKGVDILAESEMPAFGFKKIGLDLTDNTFKSVPANCATPGVRLQGTAIDESVIDTINLSSFRTFSEVVTNDVLTWRRIPGKIKAYVGAGWDDKLSDAINEQMLKNMLYQMLIGGVKFDVREEAITAHSLVRYIIQKPGASTLRTFFKHAEIDIDDRLAVYQAWSSEGVRDLITDIYAKNPYFNATSREVVAEYNRYVNHNGNVDLSQFGVNKDIVEDSQEFSAFNSQGRVLSAMEAFIGKKRGTAIGKAARKSVGGQRVRPSGPDPAIILLERSLARKQYTYCQDNNVSERAYWGLFDAEFIKRYDVSITQKFQESGVVSRTSWTMPKYLRATGLLTQANEIAEHLSQKAALGRRLNIALTPSF